MLLNQIKMVTAMIAFKICQVFLDYVGEVYHMKTGERLVMFLTIPMNSFRLPKIFCILVVNMAV